MLINNLIYIIIKDNFLGFLDTGGISTFLFRNYELSKELGYKFIENKDLDYLDKKVILFVGNDYWKNKIYLFNYIDTKFEFINRIPKKHELL
jgi:hypothetical protein